MLYRVKMAYVKVAWAACCNDFVPRQHRTLYSESSHRRASAIDKKALALSSLLRTRHRHSKLVIQSMPDGGDSNSDSGGLLVCHVLWDFESETFFRHTVLAERPVFEVRRVRPVTHARDPIADFVVFGDFRSEGDDSAGEVASYRDSGCGESGDVNVLPVIVVNWKDGGRWSS